MNHSIPEPGPNLSRALHLLSEMSGEASASAAWLPEIGAAILPWLERRSPPLDDLIIATGHSAGPEWHASRLELLCRKRPQRETQADAARRRYHARMLGYALAPEQDRFKPLVTILIPVFDRAGPLAEAVRSCVDQTWRPIEILVIDDGSADDVESALAPFGAQVRLIRKPNGGVASARNLGLSLARGDFIQLLDSDDLLLPTALESKIAAFASVADADLCYGQSQWIDMRTSPPSPRDPRLRELNNPIRSLIVDFAFPVPSVMMPRWCMLAMPPFDEDLRRSSDFRYWQRLGFAGIKVVGTRTLTVMLRRFNQSLHTSSQPDDSHAVALLRGLGDLFRHPNAWPYAREYLNIITDERVQYWFSAARSERVQRALLELVTALREAGAMRGAESLSILPVLTALHGRIGRLRKRGQWPDRDSQCVYHVLAMAIADSVETAPPITDRDVALWTREPEAPIQYRRLHDFFITVNASCPNDEAAELADALLRRARKVPSARIAKLAARLRPMMGARLAAKVAARWTR